MLAALSAALEARDPSARGHSARVSAIAVAVARQLGWTEPALATVRVGGELHDVGKLSVPEGILGKPGPLAPDELARVRRHPAAGARLVGEVRRVRCALPSVLYHHERWDGRGYPTGRSGTAIPVEARLLAIADAYDAMTSTRPYALPLSPREAIAEVERCSGSQFDPLIARAFIEALTAGFVHETASSVAVPVGV